MDADNKNSGMLHNIPEFFVYLTLCSRKVYDPAASLQNMA